MPGQTPANDRGKTLLLVHADVHNPKISDQALLDDKLIEVSWEGEILWSWSAHEHFDELGFDDAAKAILFRDPGLRKLAAGSVGDWYLLAESRDAGAHTSADLVQGGRYVPAG